MLRELSSKQNSCKFTYEDRSHNVLSIDTDTVDFVFCFQSWLLGALELEILVDFLNEY